MRILSFGSSTLPNMLEKYIKGLIKNKTLRDKCCTHTTLRNKGLRRLNIVTECLTEECIEWKKPFPRDSRLKRSDLFASNVDEHWVSHVWRHISFECIPSRRVVVFYLLERSLGNNTMLPDVSFARIGSAHFLSNVYKSRSKPCTLVSTGRTEVRKLRPIFLRRS